MHVLSPRVVSPGRGSGTAGSRAQGRGARTIWWVARPLLFLDVDGVLNPYDTPRLPLEYAPHLVRGHMVRLNAAHGVWLAHLAQVYEVVWASLWGATAPAEIGRRLGLAEAEAIDFTCLQGEGEPDCTGATFKLGAVAARAGDRPCAWVDDDFHDDARTWATQRGAPTLLVQPDPHVGLTGAHIIALMEFAAEAGCYDTPDPRWCAAT